MENHGGMISTGENTSVHQSSLSILPAESFSSKAGGTGKGNEFCHTKYLSHALKGSLTCHKILQHGANGFTSL
jgi:hypothetical protein